MRNFFKNLGVAPENYSLVKILYFSFFTNGLMSVMLGTLLPYISDENQLTNTQTGMIWSAHQLGNLCAVLIAGVLPFLIGQKKSTLLMSAGTVIGLILMTVTHNPLPLIVAFLLSGAGRGTLSNTCNSKITDVSENKAGALNLLHAVFAIGALVSPVFVYVFTIDSDSGWKASAWAVAVLSLFAWVLIARSKLPNKIGTKEKKGSFTFLKSTSFWINTMILFFYLCAETSIIGWFVKYFRDEGILSPGAAKFTPTMLWIMIMIGRLSCAAISSRVNKNKLLLTLSIAFSLCYLGMLIGGSSLTAVIFLLGIGLSMGGIYPTTLSAMKGASSAVSIGFTIAIASVGGILMPTIVGAVADTHGLAGGVATVLATLFVLVLFVIIKMIMDNTKNKKVVNSNENDI